MLLRIGGLVLAALAGWLFGRTTPHWAEDRWREDTPHMGMDAYFDAPIDRTASYGGCFGDIAAGPARFFTNLRSGMWLPLILGAAGFILAELGWEHNKMKVALHPGLVYFFLTGIACYIVSRLTDRGPVGPLR